MGISEILLVDDEVLLRELLSEALQEDGFNVTEASSGDSAWALIEQGLAFDMLLSDVRMPGKIDGIELARKVKSTQSKAPIILMSGHIVQHDVEPGLARFLPKPFIPSRITSIIKEMS